MYTSNFDQSSTAIGSHGFQHFGSTRLWWGTYKMCIWKNNAEANHPQGSTPRRTHADIVAISYESL